LTPAHREFIARQRIFFTASATSTSRVNVSPRPTVALRVLDERTVAYLDLTGSGSETAAHLRVDGRITLMSAPWTSRHRSCGFTAAARASPATTLTTQCCSLQSSTIRSRRARARSFAIEIDLVQTSCGYGERTTLHRWAEQKGDKGLEVYRRQKNTRSLDGLPNGLAEEETSSVSASLSVNF
jgi:ribosomal protein L37E